MTTTVDLDLEATAVKESFTELENNIRRCDNGEGMLCSDLGNRINFYAELCNALRAYVGRWARAVFEGRIEFDSESESVFKKQIALLLRRADLVAAQGRQMDKDCLGFAGLHSLHAWMAELYHLQVNWVSPRLSVGTGPRVRLSPAAEQEIAERIKLTKPLPADWHPSDPAQDAVFQKLRAK